MKWILLALPFALASSFSYGSLPCSDVAVDELSLMTAQELGDLFCKTEGRRERNMTIWKISGRRDDAADATQCQAMARRLSLVYRKKTGSELTDYQSHCAAGKFR